MKTKLNFFNNYLIIVLSCLICLLPGHVSLRNGELKSELKDLCFETKVSLLEHGLSTRRLVFVTRSKFTTQKPKEDRQLVANIYSPIQQVNQPLNHYNIKLLASGKIQNIHKKG